MHYKRILLAVAAAQSVNCQLTDEDLTVDMNNALLGAQHQNTLSTSIPLTSSVLGTAPTTSNAIVEFAEFADPYLAVLGMVSGLWNLFFGEDEYAEILDMLNSIQNQIMFLQADMEYYFKKVLAAVD